MISRIHVLLRRLARSFNRSEWAIRLLRLSRSTAAPSAPGLVLIQIDGLARSQFEAAMAAGRLPSLERLLHRERYQVRSLYTGVPCTTPAVQAELFYGVRTAVPAFSFMHPESGSIVKMFEPSAARELEDRLQQAYEPLLAGGAAYCNIFAGGAAEAEAHFCVASLGWGPVMRTANPFALGFLLLTNLASAVRVAGLLVLELGLAVIDFARGLYRGSQLGKEIKFIPTRVAICIGLRELITVGARIDIARGLPIIHLNFVGYDEQAHRRGPRAAFAHWALKGIDRAIERIWRETRRSPHRDYRVWIYSDHGQEHVVPYPVLFGRSVEDAIGEVYDGMPSTNARAADRGVQSHRARTIGGTRLQRVLPTYGQLADQRRPDSVRVVAMGPLGFIYLPHAIPFDGKRRLATELIAKADIPIVLARDEAGKVHAWTENGESILPGDGDAVVGQHHPFRAEVIDDLMTLCQHPGAGDLVIGGWRAGAKPLSFAVENGAHGGFGPEETHGVALFDETTMLTERPLQHVRAEDIRQAALHVLGRAPLPLLRRKAGTAREATRLRFMTYNVHSCRGMDGKVSPARIARVIAQSDPDIVALQELDVGRKRTDAIDQARLVADILAMEMQFHPAISVQEEQYGDAILSRLPMTRVKAAPLPRLGDSEPRGAVWVAVDLDGIELQIINTHLSLRPAERRLQIDTLLGADWLAAATSRGPVVFCGDLNASPRSYVYRALGQSLRDVQRAVPGWRPRSTWFGAHPTLRLDHIFVAPQIDVIGVEIADTGLARMASDHLPLVSEICLREVSAARRRQAHRSAAAAT